MAEKVLRGQTHVPVPVPSSMVGAGQGERQMLETQLLETQSALASHVSPSTPRQRVDPEMVASSWLTSHSQRLMSFVLVFGVGFFRGRGDGGRRGGRG